MQWQRIRNLPAGIWIAGIVFILIGGRCLWIAEGRPPHEKEIVNTYGSVRLFYGAPQTDSQGQNVTFVATADLGYGLFLADTATGHKILVYDETNNDDYTWNLHGGLGRRMIRRLLILLPAKSSLLTPVRVIRSRK